MALIHSEGVLAGEMKHGTLALVDETLPILVVCHYSSSCCQPICVSGAYTWALDVLMVMAWSSGMQLSFDRILLGCSDT